MKNRESKILRANAPGFTLVELLLVIAIIAVLSSMAVGVIGSAQNDARVAATQSRISILEQVIQTELESYEVRRSPIPDKVLVKLTNQIITTNTLDPDRYLVHYRNLRRVINADLVRAEMPNGRGDVNALGIFPSPELRSYLLARGVPLNPPAFVTGVVTPLAISDLARFRPAGARRWNSWDLDNDGDTVSSAALAADAGRPFNQRLADSSELLYGLLTQIDFNGSTAIDALGSQAFADTDGDELLEVVDAWNEPIGFQFQQENLTQATTADFLNGVWASSGNFTDFEVRGNDLSDASQRSTMASAVRPIRADQLRPYFQSNEMVKRDGDPVDFVEIP